MIHRIHELVWGPWLLVLFLGIGIIYTVKSGFFQIRRLPYWWKMTIGSIREEELEEEGAVTKFQTACTALAATIGTGNIVGVATLLDVGVRRHRHDDRLCGDHAWYPLPLPG